MPITCPIHFSPLSQPEMAALDYGVMSLVFEVHQELGCLCDEIVYRCRLRERLCEVGVEVDSPVPVTLAFRSFLKPLYPDLVVNRQAIYELKAVSALAPAHAMQLINYLFLTGASRGKLVNFRPTSVEWEFVNGALSPEERRRFDIESSGWHGSARFREMVESLVSDWGTGLDQTLYAQAITHCLGGEDVVVQQVPMRLGDASLGNQRFHLLDPDTAFCVTTFQDQLESRHARQLEKLLAPSPLKSMQWINVGRHRLTFRSIRR